MKNIYNITVFLVPIGGYAVIRILMDRISRGLKEDMLRMV